MGKSSEKSAKATPQKGLGLKLDEKTLFSLSRFHPGSANKIALDAAKIFIRGKLQRVLVITGKPKSGKSHLLKGICYSWSGPAFYMDAQHPPDEFPAVSANSLFCIDNLETPGSVEFNDRVFNLFNAISDNGAFLAVALRPSPAKCAGMPDYLSSRLLTGMVVTLTKPDDEEMEKILAKMAVDRSFSLTPKARDYILSRSGRSVAELYDLVERIENEIEPGSARIGLQLLKRVLN